jgi:purine-binding chemotaxis protein CheW
MSGMAGTGSPRDTTWTGFELDGQAFALPAGLVERVLPAGNVTALPFAPSGIEGVASVAGDVVPVVALAAMVSPDRPASTTPAVGQFLVVHVAGQRFALRIERMLFTAAALSIEAGQAMWRSRTVTCLDAAQLGLAALEPWSPPIGASGEIANSRDGRSEAAARPPTMVLAVEAGGRPYGLPAASAVELVERATVTPVPLVSPELRGVMVLRGQPILAFCLNRLLGQEPAAAPRGHVILAFGRSRVALLVDGIIGLQRATADQVLLDPEQLIGAEGMSLAAQMPSAVANGGPTRGAGRQRFLCVTVGGRTYGLALSAVERVLPPRQSVLLPAGAPDGIDGAIEYGGRIIPVTESWRWLSLADTGTAGAHIVLHHEGEQRALAVNAVQRIVSIARDDILPTGGQDPRIAALGTANGRPVEILSTAALLARREAA